MDPEDLEEMDKRLAKQEKLGADIEAVVKNHKKAGQDRKSQQYYEKRLKQLTELGNEFNANNEWLQNKDDKHKQSDYFKSNYYSLIKNLVDQYKEVFYKELSELSTSTTEQPQIVSFIKRQNVMMSSLSRLLQSTVPEDAAAPSLRVKEKLWEQIQELHFSIFEKFNQPESNGYDMTAYIKLEKEAMQVFAAATQTPNSNVMTPTTAPSKIPLPKINIPPFNGDYGKWPTFADLFEKVVHSQPISDVQKMWYLKANLKGEAERLIRHLALTETNYTTAWKTLNERYNNKRVLAATLIQNILDTPNVNSDAEAIKGFHDTIQENLAALANMKIPVDGWDPLLLQLLVKKLDRHTHGLYETSIKNPRELQTIDKFLEFLEQRFQALESLGSKDKAKHDKQHKEKSKATASVATTNFCKLCNQGEHPLYSCDKFKNTMKPSERLNWVQGQRLCVNCFKSDHKARACKSRACPKCNQKHNSMLHLERKNSQQSASSASSATATSASTSMVEDTASTEGSSVAVTAASSARRASKETRNYVLLATAKVRITANNGQVCEARAVLDSGSQVNLVTQRLVNKLSLNTTKSQLSIEGVGLSTGNSRACINVRLESFVSNFSTRFEAFVLPQIISAQPSRDLDITTWNIPHNLKLADPAFFKSEKIDILRILSRFAVSRTDVHWKQPAIVTKDHLGLDCDWQN